ncbi:MAG TPA: DUF4337 family protein [Gemmatirosa sp.]
MPEEAEVDLDAVHEHVHHEAEHEGAGLTRRIALSTSVLAALAAVSSLQAGGTVNEALALKTEATRYQAEASDQWSYYQAKGIKAAVAQAAAASWSAAGKAPPAALAAAPARYAHDQDSARTAALAKEHARDEVSREADALMAKHHGYAYAVALFQVAIALGAVAALTRMRAIWLGSLLLGGVGIILDLIPLLRGG